MFDSQPRVVVNGDGNLLLRAKLAFGSLDRGVAEQEFDLFEVSAVLATELDPHGDGHSANAAAFAVEIGDHPAPLALLNILFGERGQFDPARSAARPPSLPCSQTGDCNSGRC